jgi:hypothetical protein
VAPDVSTTTTTTTTNTTGGSTSNASSANTASTTGSSVSIFYDPAKQPIHKLLDLQLTASGIRQSTVTPNIDAFIAPTLATSFQVEAPVRPTTGQ